MRLVTLLSLLLVLVAIPAARPLSDPHTHAQAHLLRSQHRVTMGQASRLGLRGGSCADGLNAPEHARAEKMEGTARLSAQMTALWSHTEQLRRFASSPATLPPAGPAAGAAAGIGGSTIQDPGSDAGGGGGVGGADGAAKEQRIESEEQAEQAVRALEEQLSHPSALFRHELCYALGQTGRASAGATLRAVLSNREEHEMVPSTLNPNP
ncbi:hypothetical protein T484DRAFT_1746652 [Baffinella frigidus]|nr:hypothetical protein T484DRAFT_1746652 [Cryptophyta sp. CCMP2293]